MQRTDQRSSFHGSEQWKGAFIVKNLLRFARQNVIEDQVFSFVFKMI